MKVKDKYKDDFYYSNKTGKLKLSDLSEAKVKKLGLEGFYDFETKKKSKFKKKLEEKIKQENDKLD